jgi:SCY1-like protein 2
MASFFSQASSYFGRTNISANYSITDSSSTPTTHAGLWKIQRAIRSAGGLASLARPSTPNVAANGEGSSDGTGQASTSSNNEKASVSVWSHVVTTRGKSKDLVVEVLKKEASSLTRLRHPCILEVAEPLEEVRSELTFATEPVMASLSQALLASESSGRASDSLQLDEIEIQKGLLQVARGLEFLHGAGLVHGNLTPDAILVNVKGDWKLSGFGFLTPLKQPDGSLTPFEYPDYDPSLPAALSRNFDYLAPEYALDEKREPANDIYSLGCVMFAAHNKGEPPFRNRNSLQNIRQNADNLGTVASSSTWQRMGRDLINVLSTLLTRYPGARPDASAFQRSEYFNNMLTQTLKFMERDNFAGKTKEERVSFLKGLLRILDQFSDRLLRRKVLPALLELMNDRTLLPFILPNVFVISKNLSSIEFTTNVLPKLKPLFNVQDPPQNQLILLEQIELFVSKTSPPVFREQVTPLLYSALEAESVPSQEKALQTVPRLCEVLEYSHVKEVLFPKIATLFTKTRVLSVKCNTLICFHSMISVLDKYTLTEKLVPILARIKTREPSVMVATLAVHDAMAKKVDRETLATSIIPQLWAMSMGPQLTAEQFQRFMRAIDEMGERVKKEHLQHLQEQKRMQDHTESYVAGSSAGGGDTISGLTPSGDVDFATLVGSAKAGGQQVARDMPVGGNVLDVMSWDDLDSTSVSTPAQSMTPTITPSHTGSTKPANNGFNTTSSTNTLTPSSLSGNRTIAPPPINNPVSRPSFTSNLSSSSNPSKPNVAPPPGWSGNTLSPSSSSTNMSGFGGSSASGPNYNISLTPASSNTNSSSPLALTTNSFAGLPPLVPQTSSLGSQFSMPPAAPTITPSQPVKQANTPGGPPGWGGSVLQPTSKSGSAAQNNMRGANNSAWTDFDPLN